MMAENAATNGMTIHQTPQDPARGQKPVYDIAGLIAARGDIPVITEPVVVRRRSRDFFWYSPILAEELKAV
ncbi:hypothetical protein, partial [Proteus mirabilis]|uniref:hypothetical protein n=1 Tax=Proteus mirabilis TaxID=584 RepID=UPI001952E146